MVIVMKFFFIFFNFFKNKKKNTEYLPTNFYSLYKIIKVLFLLIEYKRQKNNNNNNNNNYKITIKKHTLFIYNLLNFNYN